MKITSWKNYIPAFLVKGIVLMSLVTDFFELGLPSILYYFLDTVLGFAIFEVSNIYLLLFIALFLLSVVIIKIIIVAIKPSAKIKVYLYAIIGVLCVVDIVFIIELFLSVGFFLEEGLGAIADVALILMMLLDMKLLKRKTQKAVKEQAEALAE